MSTLPHDSLVIWVCVHRDMCEDTHTHIYVWAHTGTTMCICISNHGRVSACPWLCQLTNM